MKLESSKYREAVKQADLLIAEANSQLDAVRTDLEVIVSETGGELVGLDHAVKTRESLVRKIVERTRPNQIKKLGTENAVQISASRVNDALRFTVIYPTETYASDFEQLKLHFESTIYVYKKVYNGWNAIDGTYKGLNITFATPAGFLFEVQVHTAESFRIKSETHYLYEEARNSKTSKKDRKLIDDKQRSAYVGIEVPENVETIE